MLRFATKYFPSYYSNQKTSKIMIPRLLLFLLLNFLALGIGGYFTGPGVSSDWYTGLSKAPWTPPGWVFGFAWTSIMLCFSFYMAMLWKEAGIRREALVLYGLQWLLNVLWNPLFFHFRQTGIGLLDIVSLTVLVALFLFRYRREMAWKSALLLPYFLWLLIATSLNAWIVWMN